MTIAATSPRIEYTGDGASTVFAVPFPFLGAAHLVVTAILSDTVETEVIGTDYSVAGAGDPAGGAVTFRAAPAHGVRIAIRRETPRVQQTEWLEGQKFPAAAAENALDRLTMIAQELTGMIDRCLRQADNGVWDAGGRRIVNVGDAIGASDAATRQQVLDWLAAPTAPAPAPAPGNLPWFPVSNKAELEVALAAGYRDIGIYGEIQGGLEIDVENIIFRSFMPPGVPVFRGTGPGQTLLRIKATKVAFIGDFTFRGHVDGGGALSSTGIDILGGTDTLMFGRCWFTYCARDISIMPTGAGSNADVRYVYFAYLNFDRASDWCMHLFGATSANVITYIVVDKMDANTQDIAFTGDVIKIGDNVGSGGSPGFVCFWPMLYRYNRQIHIYCTAAPLQGTNVSAPRKIYFFNASLRGSVGDALVIEDGDEIVFWGLTLDDSDGKNAYIGPDFVGQYRVYNLVSKDAWKEGWHHDAPMSGCCEINGIEVSNNSYKTARTGQFTFTGNPAPGDTFTVTVGPASLTGTFVAAAPVGDQVLIGATQDDTLSNLGAFLDASPSAAMAGVEVETDLAADTVYLRLGTGGFNPVCTAASAAIAATTPGIVNATPGDYSGVRIHPSTRQLKISNGTVGVGASWRKQTGTLGNNGTNVVAGDTYTIAGIPFTYVASGATGNQILLGATAAESLANAFAAFVACADPTIQRLRFSLDLAAGNIAIQGDFWDPAYAGLITLGITPLSNMTRSNTVLSGGTGTPSQKYGIEYGGAPNLYGEGVAIENVRLEGNILGGTNHNAGALLSRHGAFTTAARDPTVIGGGVTAGTASAQTLAVGYALAPLAPGDMIRFTPGLDGSGLTTLALYHKGYLIDTLPLRRIDGTPATVIAGRPMVAMVSPDRASMIVQPWGIPDVASLGLVYAWELGSAAYQPAGALLNGPTELVTADRVLSTADNGKGLLVTAGTVTITLPPASVISETFAVTIKRRGATALTIARQGADTINGAGSNLAPADGASTDIRHVIGTTNFEVM